MKRILLCTLLMLLSLVNLAFAQSLTVKMLDVGQGDAFLIQTDEQNILIDTSDTKNRDNLTAELDRAGVDTIHKLILTHPHADHIANSAYLIKNFNVQSVYDNGQTSSSVYYRQYLKQIKTANIARQTLRAGDTLTFGEGVTFAVFNPDIYFKSVNDNSICGKLVFGDFAMLFTGDIEAAAEYFLTDYDIKADVLKACHHGSKTSNTLDFLNYVKPEYVLISCATDNKYGHPHSVALDNFVISGVNRNNIFCTAFNGTVTIQSDGSTFTVTPAIQTVWIDEYLGYRLTVKSIY